MIGDTWSPTASMRTLKYFLADAEKHRARVHQLDFIGEFLQANVKNRVFVKLDMRYASYFPEYTQYFGRALKLLGDDWRHLVPNSIYENFEVLPSIRSKT